MEKDDEMKGAGNHYTSHFRQYDSRLGRWLSIDPLAGQFEWQSPYSGINNNPILLMDPKGDSTFVNSNSDGTYTVIGGTLDDNDNGIYVKGSNGQVTQMIGYSATPESFYNSEENKWMGTIDPKDESGREFLNSDILTDDPNLLSYMKNATGGKKYDFKRTNGTDKVLYDTPEKYYRGMPLELEGEDASLPVFASARDVGNIAAGFVAGNSGMSWGMARFGFDALQTSQVHGKTKTFWFYPYFGVYEVEGSSTQYAERLGFRIGKEVRAAQQAAELKRLPSYGDIKIPVVSNSILYRNDYTPITK